MPAQVRVDVKVEDQKALQQLSNLEKQVAKLNQQSINIKINTGSGSTSAVQKAAKEVKDLDTVLAEAGLSALDLGKKTDTMAKTSNGALVELQATFKKTQGEIEQTAKVSSKGSVVIKQNLDKVTNSAEKAADAMGKKYRAAVEKMTTGAVKASNAYLAQQREEEKRLAEEQAKADNARIARLGKVGLAMASAFAVKEIKEALSVMKEVDSELANIRKVTDESAEAIARLGKQAYGTASKYGVSASDYLKNAADFAKAGYGNYANIAELAIKTQLVGDVTADMASKFLLSADAAYKFQGNVESLTTVLDRANWVENNYATSIEKIADGFPIVASTASMANMSIEELVASLGTITSVTQETGRRAATALRALILNITGEIGEVLETEEGEYEVTAQTVESMSDALQKYGSEAIKAAKATGELIDPIEALRSLAKAYNEGDDLTRSELFNILSEVGGKLRTNQLAALVENFSMFEDMLEGMGEAAGSADRELVPMLDTWEAKANQLKNSWTELVSDIADTSFIKGVLDFATSALNYLDSRIESASDKLTHAENNLGTAKETYESAFGENGTLKRERENLEAHEASLNEFDRQRLEYLREQEASLLRQQNYAATLSRDAWINYANENVNPWYKFSPESRIERNLSNITSTFTEVTKADGSKNRKEIATTLNGIIEEYQSFYDSLKAFEELGFNLFPNEREFIEQFEKVKEAYSNAVDDMEEEAERLGSTLDDEGKKVSDSYKITADSIDEAANALERFAESTEHVKSANADAYRSDYQKFLADWEAGKTDTSNVRAAIDLFIPAEMQRQMGYDMQALGEWLSNEMYQGIFNGSLENSAADFANWMFDNYRKELDGIARLTQEADGSLTFEYASAKKLADALQLPIPVIEALIEALDEYGVEAEMGWEDTEKWAEILGLLGNSAESAETKIRNTISALGQMGMVDPYEIQKALNEFAQAGYLNLSEFSAKELGDMISQELKKVSESGENSLTVEVDAEKATETLGELGDQINEVPDSKKTKVTVTVSGIGSVKDLASALYNLPSQVNTNVTVSSSSGKSSASSVVVKPSQRNSTLMPMASGTKNSPGGPTLVNELGPELISDNGRAYIANGGKPAIVSLGKGAIVLTAEETRQAIGGIHAAASGIPRASGTSGLSTSYNAHVESSGQDMSEEEIVREQAKALETLAEYYHNMKQHSEEAASYQEAINKLERIRAWYRANGLTETDTRMASVANEIFALQEKVAEANTHAIDDLEEELENLDDQIRLAEYQGDTQKALLLEQQAQKKIAELIKAYQDAGYSDTSDEILRLVNNGYSYSESSDSRLSDMRKDLIAAIKAMKETQDEANDLAEKQLAVTEARTALENAQNQRTVRIFNPVTGQWEWVANAGDVLDAQEALKSAEDALAKEQQSRELDALEKALGNGTSLSDISIGPALSALISGANVEETNALATALGVLTGGIKTTADTSAKSVFDNIDSHDSVTNYTFNGVNVGKDVAETTTLAQLARMISPLALTGNMPA